jgi:hypothetical protein
MIKDQNRHKTMTSDVDLAALRQLLQRVTGLVSTMHRHVDLREECERLGLPTPPDEGSKHERVSSSLAALPDADLLMIAEKILASQLPLDAAIRNSIQDVLWASYGSPEIPKRTRREIARALNLAELVHNPDRFRALLGFFGCWATTHSSHCSACRQVWAPKSISTSSETWATGLPRSCLNVSIHVPLSAF